MTQCVLQASPNIVIALAGNKADLANSRTVDYEEAKQYADENGLLFMETSAKTAVNVNEIFLAIGKQHLLIAIDFAIFQKKNLFKTTRNVLIVKFNLLAKRLPKNETTGAQQNIRPTTNEQSRTTGNCCNK